MNVWSNPTQRLRPYEPSLSLLCVLRLAQQGEGRLRASGGRASRHRAAARLAARGPAERGVDRGAGGGAPAGGSQSACATRPARRTCAGCGSEALRDELIRCVALESEQADAARVVVDLKGKLPGRGAWVHPRQQCFEQAARRGLARSFRQRVHTTVEELLGQLQVQATRRVQGLLLSARARGCLVFGLDTVKQHAGRAALVLVSDDARALAKDRWVQQWADGGRVTLWSTKQDYGHLLGRSEVGILAVLDAAIAAAITRTISLTRLSAPAQSAGGDAHLLSEVR